MTSRGQARRVAQRTPQPARARRSSRRRVLVMLLVAVVFVAVIGTGFVWTRMTDFNDHASTRPALSSALVGRLLLSDSPVNILVLGYGGPQHDGPYLTDSINIVSISPDDRTTMIPIPRDLWIEGLEQFPDNGKVNMAFAIGHATGGVDGGGALAADVVSAVTGLDVQFWLALDFGGFRAVVDAIGGVTVENPVGFWYGSPTAFEAGGGWDGEFPAGRLTLDGQEALYYARTRYTSEPSQSTDFARSERQQRVLEAVVAKIREAGVGAIGTGFAAMEALEGHLRTNLSVVDLALVMEHLSPDRRVELSEGTVLRATTTTDGQYVLVPIGQSGVGDYIPVARYVADQLAASAVVGATPVLGEP